MADSNIGGSKGYGEGIPVFEDYPVDWNMDELLNDFPDQQTTDPEQNLQQGFDPPAVTNGCFPEPSINQGPNEATATTHWSIAQQHSGQSPEIFTGNPSSQISADSVSRRRECNRRYREKRKREWQELEGQKKSFEAENETLKRENETLKGEKQELEGQKKSFEAENETLKRENETLKRENETLKGEKQELEEQKKSFEAENETLKRENETLKREKQELEEQKKSFEVENETLNREKYEQEKKFILETMRRDYERELAKLRNKVDTLELKQQNRTERKRSMSPTEEFWAQSQQEDSFKSAKIFRIGRRSQMPTYKRKASSDQRKASSDQWERKSAMKNPKAGFRRLKAEMQEIAMEEQCIKEGQKQVREKIEAIEAECAQLRKETDLMIRQSAANKHNLWLVFKILKAREEGDFLKATQLAQLLRTIIARQNEQRKGSI